MRFYYDASVSAIILFKEVLKELVPTKAKLENFVKNNYEKIIKRSIKKIEKRFTDVEKQQLLLKYIRNYCKEMML